jgi:hypothetical protein
MLQLHEQQPVEQSASVPPKTFLTDANLKPTSHRENTFLENIYVKAFRKNYLLQFSVPPW